MRERSSRRRREVEPSTEPRRAGSGESGTYHAENAMPIRLHKFGEAWGIADPSPFCLKIESFLREAKIAYEVAPFEGGRSFAKAPKGKLPFIEDEDGTIVGDSTLIIGRLSRLRGIDMDAPLDDGQRCVSFAFRRMLDEHFYWVGVYSRWIDEPGWQRSASSSSRVSRGPSGRSPRPLHVVASSRPCARRARVAIPATRSTRSGGRTCRR